MRFPLSAQAEAAKATRMALILALKFAQEDMPRFYEPGTLTDLKPQDFVVAPRGASEDVGFVAALEYRSSEHLKLRPDPYPKISRRAAPAEIDAWWERKAVERKAIVACKERAAALKLDIKVSHVHYDPRDIKLVFHFTCEQRIDFRVLVKELMAILHIRIELWQIGVRDEAKMLDGFGVCGQRTCCSSWLKDFHPVSIKMAKDQDINLPPVKLSGQCGRLLCCLAYEVDQYREMSRGALPKGATIKWADKEGVIIDRNLLIGTYLVAEQGSGLTTVKAADIDPTATRIPDQLKQMGKRMGGKGGGDTRRSEPRSAAPAVVLESPEAVAPTPSSEAAPTSAPPPPPARREDRPRPPFRPKPPQRAIEKQPPAAEQKPKGEGERKNFRPKKNRKKGQS